MKRLLLLVLLAGCADWFVIFPSRSSLDTGRERRLLKTKHGPLEIVLHDEVGECGPNAPAVLEFGGNAEHAISWPTVPQSAWCREPAFVWKVNYPGFGASYGSGTLNEIPDAALAAYDSLAAETDCPIYVVGNSLGTTAALWVARNRPVDGIVLKNPPPLRHLILLEYGWWNAFIGATIVALQIPPQLDSRTNALRSSVPTLQITSGKDNLVTVPTQDIVYDALRGPKRRIFIQGAGHNYRLLPHDPGLKLGLRWLQRCE